jgi:hypothetical protein
VPVRRGNFAGQHQLNRHLQSVGGTSQGKKAGIEKLYRAPSGFVDADQFARAQQLLANQTALPMHRP